MIGGNNIMKIRKFPLFAAILGALIFTAAFAPRANAILAVLYNFEDSTLGGAPDFGSVGDLGLQHPTMTAQYAAASMVSVAGLAFNGAAGDPDANNLALGLTNAGFNNLGFLQFHVDTNTLVDMNLSLAASTSNLGFSSVELLYSNDGFVSDTHLVGTESITSAIGEPISFAPIAAAAEGQSDITFRLVFNGATPNGEVPQNTFIDNIQLTATAVPEPSSYIGGLLGLVGLCWYQRRRFMRLVSSRSA